VNTVRRAHENVRCAQSSLLEPEGLANATLDTVSFHSRSRMLARDENAEPGRTRGAALIVEDESSKTAAGPAAKQPLEFDLPPQAAGFVQAKAVLYFADYGYSASRRRPRARRLRNTLRPPLVRLRTRKPWRRARRVFEGW
jgi:hypothetical protein